MGKIHHGGGKSTRLDFPTSIFPYFFFKLKVFKKILKKLSHPGVKLNIRRKIFFASIRFTVQSQLIDEIISAPFRHKKKIKTTYLYFLLLLNTVNEDCPGSRACLNNKCIDPCPGFCGLNAQCEAREHVPICSCLPRYTGDPFSACHIIDPRKCNEKTKKRNSMFRVY